MIVDPYEQKLVEVSLSAAETDGSVEQVQQTSFNISTGILEQVSGPPHIFSSVPFPLVLPKGRNIILHSWTIFFIGVAFTCRHSSFGGGSLFCLSSSHHSLFYMDVCHYGRVLITPSMHPFLLSFRGRVFPMRFSLFLCFMRELHLHYVLGYLTWPSS